MVLHTMKNKRNIKLSFLRIKSYFIVLKVFILFLSMSFDVKTLKESIKTWKYCSKHKFAATSAIPSQ